MLTRTQPSDSREQCRVRVVMTASPKHKLRTECLFFSWNYLPFAHGSVCGLYWGIKWW